MAKFSRVLLQSKSSRHYWCGIGWAKKACAVPLTDNEAAARICSEVKRGYPVTDFRAERVWVDECRPKAQKAQKAPKARKARKTRKTAAEPTGEYHWIEVANHKTI